MKIRKIVKKDLKLFKRDKKNIILIILVPVLVLTILAIVFGESSNSKSVGQVDIGLCNKDTENLPIAGPMLFKFNNIMAKDCEETAKTMVENGKLKGAVIIKENFHKDIEEGKGSEIVLYLDNSKYQTALFITDSVKAMVQDLNEKIGTEFIENAWIRLRELNNKLKIIVIHLEEAKRGAEALQLKADEINKNLDKINERQLNKYLDNANQTSSIINSQSQLEISKDIDKEIKELEDFLINECSNNANQESCTLISEASKQLKTINNKLKKDEEKVNSIISNENKTNITKQINLIKSSKENIKEEIINLNNSIYNYTNNIIITVNELNKTSELLDVYTNRDPKSIVRAVTLDINQVFGNRTYFAFLSPGLILTLLLFTSMLIVSANIVEERRKGTLARTLLSPIKIPALIVAKVIYFLILSAIEIAAMLIIAKLFGVAININLVSIMILILASINFISIGLFIGSISKTENTALLMSLVLVFPMFFLSNQFFPLDIMPKFIKSIGSILPLTISIESLDRLVTYSTTINQDNITLLIFYPIFISIFTYIMIKKYPTSS